MKTHGGGAIVNTASVNALQPGDRQGIYSITKAAVVNMTKAFAKGGPLGIRVNALLPGLTKTKFAGALFADKDIYETWMGKIRCAAMRSRAKWPARCCISCRTRRATRTANASSSTAA